MTLNVKFTDFPLGAEIDGADLSSTLDKATFDTIKHVLDERSVVVLHGQNIGPENLVRFAERFGPLLIHPQNAETLVPGFPEVMIVSNIIEKGRYIGAKDAGRNWHSDGSYLPEPDMYTFLHGIEIPQKNGKSLGDTLFASTAAAYDALPYSTKCKIDKLKAVSSSRHYANFHMQHAEAVGGKISVKLEKSAGIEHPVARTHPVTGRKCIFVTDSHTKHIVGLDSKESDVLLRELLEHIRRPDFMYVHNWQVGDLLIWDNAATQHRATFDYALPLRRLMHRTATVGSAPF